MARKVFDYRSHERFESVTVWLLENESDTPGEFMIETTGDPSLTAAQFADMARRVAAADKDRRRATMEKVP